MITLIFSLFGNLSSILSFCWSISLLERFVEDEGWVNFVSSLILILSFVSSGYKGRVSSCASGCINSLLTEVQGKVTSWETLI